MRHAAGFNAGCGDARDRRFMEVNQRDIGAIIGLVILSIHANALGADWVIARAESFGRGRVFHGFTNFAAHEIRRRVIRGLIQQQVAKGTHEGSAAHGPAFFVFRLAFFSADRHGGRVAQAIQNAGAHHACLLPQIGVIALPALFILIIHRAVARWNAEIGRALENRELRGLLRNHGDGLNGRRPGADHRHPAAGEINLVMRPIAGVELLPFEIGKARNIWQPGRGKAACRHEEIPR